MVRPSHPPPAPGQDTVCQAEQRRPRTNSPRLASTSALSVARSASGADRIRSARLRRQHVPWRESGAVLMFAGFVVLLGLTLEQ